MGREPIRPAMLRSTVAVLHSLTPRRASPTLRLLANPEPRDSSSPPTKKFPHESDMIFRVGQGAATTTDV